MKYNLIIRLLLIAATLTVFGQSVGFEFLNFDDPLVVNNSHVRAGLTVEGAWWALTTGEAFNWHPVTWLSHMLDSELFGSDPAGCHATNVALHVINVLLLFGALHSMTGARWRSAAVAALFALHPLRVESVVWIAERKDVLSATFGLAALWAYAAYVHRGGWNRYLVVFVLLALGLMSKPMLVTLPLVMLLLDHWPLGRIGSPGADGRGGETAPSRPLHYLVIEKLPLLVLSAGASIVTFLVQRSGAAMDAAAQVTFVNRAKNAVAAYGWYLIKTVWPSNLSVSHMHPNLPGGTPWQWWQVAVAGIVLMTITIWVIRHQRRGYAIVGWLWWLGMLVPVTGLVQVGGQAVAERYTYLPLIGVFIAVVWVIAEIASSLWLRRVVQVAVVAVLTACMATAWVHAGKFRSTKLLFNHALTINANDPIAHAMLGDAYTREMQLAQAIRYFRRAVEIAPKFGRAHADLGLVLLRQSSPGDTAQDEAIKHLTLAVSHGGKSADVMSQLGQALQSQGRTDESIAVLESAVQSWPHAAQPHNALAWILATDPQPERRDAARAIRFAERAVAMTNRQDPSILDTLATAHAAAAQFDQAVAIAAEAIGMARRRQLQSLTGQISNRLELFQRGQSYVEQPR